MDCGEAAQIMQISVSAMESLLVRGRRTLRERLRRSANSCKRRAEIQARRAEWQRGTPMPFNLRIGHLAIAPA
jgi:hypothetical protein